MSNSISSENLASVCYREAFADEAASSDALDFVQAAERVDYTIGIRLIRQKMKGLHDIYISENPPRRKPIPIIRVDDRVGTQIF